MSAGGGGGSVGVNSNRGGKYTRKMRRRQFIATGLMLTSMLDILTTILFFLMKNYSQVQSNFTIAKDMSLPSSTAVTPPTSALQLVVTEKSIMLDNELIANIVNGNIERAALSRRDNDFIVPLAQKLAEQKKRSVIQNDLDKKSFAGTIVLQADKNLRFNLLKKVIYTAGVSDFVMLKLAVLKKDQG